MYPDYTFDSARPIKFIPFWIYTTALFFQLYLPIRPRPHHHEWGSLWETLINVSLAKIFRK